ncbi:hypothetical protein N9U45_02530 [Acidimicrobiaceae bacterium]|nr:hypothetical protein [Acidimicrobiaceae bacterium]
MTNYLKTFRNIFYFVLAIQASLVLFGILRPSIIYDYLDNWPLSLLPILILFFNKIYLSNSKFDNYIFGFLIIVYSLFPAVLLSGQEILTTNTYSSSFRSSNFEKDIVYSLNIDIDGSVNLNSFEGSGYIIDIQNRPGNIGFPEAIESNLGNPRLVQFREIETDRLLQVKGWDLQLGNQTLWNLYVLSFGSYINLNDINLITTEIIGTGEINLGDNLNSRDIVISGNFNIYVDSNLPIVVVGQAEVPARWINATIGYLNQTNENYKFKIIVEEGSNVTFQDGE